MSGGRFWLNPDDSDEDLYSSEDETQEQEVKPTQSRFAIDFDEEEEEEKRVVRSARDKKLDEIQQSIKKLRNSMKINDWNSISSEWENLIKIHEKARSVLEKEGPPTQVVKVMMQLEDLIQKTQADKEAKDRMSSSNSKSFNTTRQKFKKWVKTSGFDKLIEAQRKNPTPDDEEEEAPLKKEEKKTQEKQAPAAAPAPAAPAAKPKSTDDFSEDEYSDESDTDAVEEEKGPAAPAKQVLVGRAKWVKRPGQESSSDEDDSDFDDDWDEEDDKKKKKKKEKKRKEKEKEKEKEKKQEAPSKIEKPEEWTADKIEKKVKELLAKRGTRGYDRLKQVQHFQGLIEIAKTIPEASTPAKLLRIMFHLVDAQFDANPNMATYLPVPMWKSCFNTIARIILMLQEQGDAIKLVDVEPDLDAPPNVVRGPLLAHVERLGDEYIKSLLNMDPHTQDYLGRMRDEAAYLKLVRLAQDYFASRNQMSAVAALAARRLEHLYYKRERAIPAVPTKDDKKPDESKPDGELSASTDSKIKEEPLLQLDVPEDAPLQQVVESICHLIYKYGDDKLKRKCMLQQIYFLAIHDRFFEARDMMLMSRLQDTVGLADAGTQVLFNRALVQLGLAAFRKGRIADAHAYLSEIGTTLRARELLAQGFRFQDKTQEQERKLQQRQIPYPMHINIELIESVALICGLLLEVPNMASSPYDSKKKIARVHFKRALRNFSGTPENHRDYIIVAAKALSRGEWQQCFEILAGLDFWKLVPQQESVKAMLRRKVQEEGLRTYLFAYSQHFDAISLEELSKLFELEPSVVRSIVNKMILNDELQASWDQPLNAIVIHRAETTRLQYLALQFAELNKDISPSDAFTTPKNVPSKNYRPKVNQPVRVGAWIKRPAGRNVTHDKF